MTRKDYEAIAKAFDNHINDESKTVKERQDIANVAFTLSAVFQHDNERFDRVRFLDACGIVGA